MQWIDYKPVIRSPIRHENKRYMNLLLKDPWPGRIFGSQMTSDKKNPFPSSHKFKTLIKTNILMTVESFQVSPITVYDWVAVAYEIPCLALEIPLLFSNSRTRLKPCWNARKLTKNWTFTFMSYLRWWDYLNLLEIVKSHSKWFLGLRILAVTTSSVHITLLALFPKNPNFPLHVQFGTILRSPVLSRNSNQQGKVRK